MGNDDLSRLKGMDRLVSVQFTNVIASDVLKWLTKQNVNFVANVDKLPKSKITMNLSNVPLHEALETVAESLGGLWQVKRSALMFKTNMFGTMPVSPATMGKVHLNWRDFPSSSDMKGFGKIDDKQIKAFEKSMSGMKGQMKSIRFDAQTIPKMDLKQHELLKAFSGDPRTFNFKMDPKALAEMKNFKEFSKDGKAFVCKFDQKALLDMQSMKHFKGFEGMNFNKLDTEKFAKSLSQAQRELMAKQGYLKFSDLIEVQKGLIFSGSTNDVSQDFTFIFSVSGEKIRIKSK